MSKHLSSDLYSRRLIKTCCFFQCSTHIEWWYSLRGFCGGEWIDDVLHKDLLHIIYLDYATDVPQFRCTIVDSLKAHLSFSIVYHYMHGSKLQLCSKILISNQYRWKIHMEYLPWLVWMIRHEQSIMYACVSIDFEGQLCLMVYNASHETFIHTLCVLIGILPILSIICFSFSIILV